MKALLLICLAMPSIASAGARARQEVTQTSRNDGNTRLVFSVACSSFAWTVVGSSQSVGSQVNAFTEQASIRRRSMTVQTLATVTYAVCLSSTSASGDVCDDSRAGYELGAAFGSVTIFDENVWNCRTRTGGSTQIKGVDFYDNRDGVK